MTPARVVLVVGPRLAGVDGVVAALGAALPEVAVSSGRGPAGAAIAGGVVVAVVSAVAPLTRTDWGLVERAAVGGAPVVAVVSKIDAHRRWRDVLEADRASVAGWNPRRRSVPWVGIAAAPDLGEPRLGDLVELVRDRLRDTGGEIRPAVPRAHEAAARRALPRVDAAARRRDLQRTRLQLLRFIRDQCFAMRTELRARAAAAPAGGTPDFETEVRLRVARVMAQLDDEIVHAVGDAAAEIAPAQALPDLPGPLESSGSSRTLESRLMAVLGIGFGLGIALASSRLLGGLARGPSLLGLAAGLVVGLALVVWVVRTRGLLRDRALLDRWVTEVTATVRWHAEAVVAERLLVVESAWVRAPAGRAAAGASPTGRADRDGVTDQYEW